MRFFFHKPTVLACVLAVLCLPAAAASQPVPAPEEFLGFKVGADYQLATYTQAIAYFRKLAESSDRIKLFDMGKTTMGQAMTYAVLSAPENLARLDQLKDAAARLSRGEGLQAEEATKLAAEGRAVVYIDGGLHADECAPAQHNIQLAYDLVSAKDPTLCASSTTSCSSSFSPIRTA